MTKRLFVGGLAYNFSESQFQEMFTAFGEIVSANIITDKFTGQSKGFGFVEMKNDADADKAIEKLNNSEVEGRKITVNIARPREEQPRFENRGNFQRDNNRNGRRNRY